MSSAESNKMSKKIPSQVFNSKVEAKKIDDWWFHEEPLNMIDENLSCGRK